MTHWWFVAPPHPNGWRWCFQSWNRQFSNFLGDLIFFLNNNKKKVIFEFVWDFFLIFRFLTIFEDFYGFLAFFLDFSRFLIFLTIFDNFYFFFKDFHFFLFLFRVIEVTTISYTITSGHKKWPKIGQNSIIYFFCKTGKKKPWPKAGAQSRPV